MTRFVFHPAYDIGFFGVERFHPFDSRKYGRAFKLLKQSFRGDLASAVQSPRQPISRDDLLRVHRPDYLDSLKSAANAAAILELPPLRHFPGWLVDKMLLQKMRWASAGTLLATELALKSGFTANLAGGYHHAKPHQGEGFCVYADVPAALAYARARGLISPDAPVAYIDLDAHQGNGVCHCFARDRSVRIFDLYNGDIYPGNDRQAQARIDHNLPISRGTKGSEYLKMLKAELPAFLDGVGPEARFQLAFYNAGTDVFAGDPLGRLGLSAADVLERDLFVINQLADRGIPAVMVPSGGYTEESHRLIYASLEAIVRTVHPLNTGPSYAASG